MFFTQILDNGQQRVESSDDDNALPDQLAQQSTTNVSPQASNSPNLDMPLWNSAVDNCDNDTTLLTQSHAEPNVQIPQENYDISDDNRQEGSHINPFDNSDNHSSIHQGISLSESEPRNSQALSVGKLTGHNVLPLSNIMPVYKGNNSIEEFTLPDDILIFQSPNEDQIKMSVYSCTEQDYRESNIMAVNLTNENFSDFSIPEDMLTSDSDYIAAQFEDLLDDLPGSIYLVQPTPTHGSHLSLVFFI